jgi:hypothetical protein
MIQQMQQMAILHTIWYISAILSLTQEDGGVRLFVPTCADLHCATPGLSPEMEGLAFSLAFAAPAFCLVGTVVPDRA